MPATRKDVDLLVRGGCVLTMDDEDRVYRPGAVAIQEDRITAVGDAAEITALYRAGDVIDRPDHAVLPGLIDAYSHAGHGMIKGVHDPHLGWPANQIYFHAATPDWWEAEAQLSALERVRFGTTTGLTVLGATPARADDAVYADAHLRGVLRVGIREMLSIGPPDPFIEHVPRPWTATDWRDGRGIARPFTREQCMEVSADVARRWHRSHNDIFRVCVHPPYLLGRFAQHPKFPHTYRDQDTKAMVHNAEDMRAFADRWKVMIHTHAFRGSLAWGARTFGAALEDIVKADVLFAHANGLSTEEVALAARTRCAVAWVPTTHENILYGVCPVIDLLAAGVRVAIATDGSAPYMSLDLWKELPRAMMMQRMDKQDPAALPVGTALRMVTADAARAMGWGDDIGSLEPGKKADLITVDLDQPHLTPRTNIPQLLGYYAQGADVANVIVDGRILMRDHRVLTVDPAAVLEWAQAEAGRAFARVDISDYLETPRGFWRSPVMPERSQK